MGLNARSYMGWQLPIRASGHSSALIYHIEADVLEDVFAKGGIAVIPGFQGVTAAGDLATLGRGGSDTSAVALAVAAKADRCDIYTDVEGVFTTDPRIVPRARKLSAITYEEMLELASVGAKVLQTRSVGLAMRYNMALQVLSSFEDKPGTLIVSDDQIEELNMEQQLITGIAHDKNEARVTLTGLPDKPGTVAAIFAPLARGNINVDMIVQSGAGTGRLSTLTFTVPRAALAHAVAELEKAKEAIGFDAIETNTEVVKISAVGIGTWSPSNRYRQGYRPRPRSRPAAPPRNRVRRPSDENDPCSPNAQLPSPLQPLSA
jgi:aspartate kinase